MTPGCARRPRAISPCRAGSPRSARSAASPSSTTACPPTCCPRWPPWTRSPAAGSRSSRAATTAASTTRRWPPGVLARPAPTFVLTLPDSGPRIAAEIGKQEHGRVGRLRGRDRLPGPGGRGGGGIPVGAARWGGAAVPGRAELRPVPGLPRPGRSLRPRRTRDFVIPGPPRTRTGSSLLIPVTARRPGGSSGGAERRPDRGRHAMRGKQRRYAGRVHEHVLVALTAAAPARRGRRRRTWWRRGRTCPGPAGELGDDGPVRRGPGELSRPPG